MVAAAFRSERGDSSIGWTSYADWCRDGDYRTYVSETRLQAETPAQLIRLNQPGGRFVDPATPDLVISLVLAGGDASGTLDLGAGRFHSRGLVGSFTVAPGGVTSEYLIEGPHDILVMALPETMAVDALLQASRGKVFDHGPLHASAHRDSAMECLILRLWAEAADGDPMGSLLAEEVTQQVTQRLARLALKAHGQVPLPTDDEPPLHGARLRRVLALIEDALDTNLTQQSLAEAAGLSPWHFARAFRGAFGTSPHRFVLMRRIARAQLLIRGSRMTLAEVAATCGFASHAHLTTAFSRYLGVPPSSCRTPSQPTSSH